MTNDPYGLPYITKILIPTRRDYAIRRDRLFDSLKSNLTKKAQILWAPAGYGKTALLVEMATERCIPVCWYSLEPEDDDPQMFLRYCLQSIRTVYPNFGVSYRSLNRIGSKTDWRTQCGFLVNALESDIDGQFAILFDDVHWIDGKRELEEVLSLLIERAPPKIHFILASRVWPSLSCLPKLAASGDLESIDVSDFRFSTDESVQLLANLWEAPASKEAAEAINKRTGGWATGIILTAKASTSDSPDDMDVSDRDMLFDYLSAEVFDQLSKPMRSFLLRTSILREFTAEFCDRLIDSSSSQQFIDQTKDWSLFLGVCPTIVKGASLQGI